MAVSESQKRANYKYEQKNIKKVCFKFNKKTDADILSRFREVGNVQGYVKALIRDDIARRGDYSDAIKN